MTKSQSSSQSPVTSVAPAGGHQLPVPRVQVLHWQPARVEGSRTIYATIAIDHWLVIKGVTCWEGRKREFIYQLPHNVEIHDPALLADAKIALDAKYYEGVDAVTLLLRG